MSEAGHEFPYRVGRLARARGLQGELVLQFFRRRDLADRPEHLRWMRLKPSLPFEIEHQDERMERGRVTHVKWLDPLRVSLRVEGWDSREAAERRVGAYFDVDPSQLPAQLFDDVDLCFEARALDADSGALIGEVVAVRDNGAQALLEVMLADHPEDAMALIPAVAPLMADSGVDEGGRWVRINVIPGLLEANTR